MRKTLHRLAAGVLGLIIGAGLLGAVYQQFSPGGALSGSWNSQNVNVAAGAPFITGTLPSGNGGTASAFTAFSGPTTSIKTFALPDASDTIATLAATSQTFTGLITAARLNVSGSSPPTVGIYRPAANSLGLTSNSTERLRIDASGTWLLAGTTAGTAGQVLTSNGTGAAPTWQAGGGAFSTGSWSTSLATGCTVAQNQDWTYSQLGSGTGSVVTISTNSTPACTSNSGAFSSAAGSVPAAIRPSATINFTGINGTDNGASAGICLQLLSDGTLAYLREGNSDDSCGATTFTTSGVKAVNMGTATAGNRSFTYRID